MKNIDIKEKNTSITKKNETSSKINGITLIALVITIVVLIILAAVAINMTVGENGLFTKAKLARDNYLIAANEEMLGLAQLEAEIDNGSKQSKGYEYLAKLKQYFGRDENEYYDRSSREFKSVSGVDIDHTKIYFFGVTDNDATDAIEYMGYIYTLDQALPKTESLPFRNVEFTGKDLFTFGFYEYGSYTYLITPDTPDNPWHPNAVGPTSDYNRPLYYKDTDVEYTGGEVYYSIEGADTIYYDTQGNYICTIQSVM